MRMIVDGGLGGEQCHDVRWGRKEVLAALFFLAVGC